MPYASEAQRRFFHTQTARNHGLTPADVHEWDAATKGKKLPERASEKKAAQSSKPVAQAPHSPKPPPLSKATTPQADLHPVALRDAAAGAGAQDAWTSSANRFNAGQQLTMPITR